jgi:hypothetical protein
MVVERAAHEMVRAQFCQAHGIGYRAFRLADENRHSRIGVLNGFEQFRRLPGGQWKFRKNHVNRFGFEACQGLAGAAGSPYGRPGRLQRLANGLPRVTIILDHQQAEPVEHGHLLQTTLHIACPPSI